MADSVQINDASQSWLMGPDADRVAAIAARRKLYKGQHRQFFFEENRTQHEFQQVGPGAKKILYITENLAGRCTLKYSDLLFGEELAVSPAAGSQDVADAIARINQASSIHPMLFSAATTASWAGSAWVQLLVRNGSVLAERVEPENVFPRYLPGTRTLSGAAIKYELRIDGANYLRVIDHQVGTIHHELWRIGQGGKLDGLASLDLISPGMQADEATLIDELTIVELPNYSWEEGHSDYAGTESLQDEVNNRRSQISRVLDKHADPAVMVLDSLFDAQGNFKMSGRAVVVSDMSKGDPVKYVVWQAELVAAAAGLADAVQAFCGQMEMAPGLLGLGSATSADSWKKYKLQASQTLARVNRKKLFLTPTIRTIYRVAMSLENAHTPYAYAIEPVSLTYSDGLPSDDADTATMVIGLTESHLMSRRMALLWIHGDQAIVEQELLEIAADEEKSLPTSFQAGGLDHAAHA